MDTYKFNGHLYAGVLITWIIVFGFVILGIKSVRVGTVLFVPFSFIALFILLGHYIELNKSVGGKGPKIYMGTATLPYAIEAQDTESLFKDAYTQVFFSMGLCTGVHYAYGSFNHIKKPVILDSFFISFIGFFYSLIAGFMAYGAIGYLNMMKNPNQV
jgi:SNF family Na+-dependent transporter